MIDNTLINPIQITALQNFEEELIVHTVIVENGVSLNDVTIDHVFRKFLPNPGGFSEFGWEENETKDFSPIWSADMYPSPSILEHQDIDSLEVVVFIQNQRTKEIYQAAKAPAWESLFEEGVLEGNSIEADEKFSLYPNPANEQVILSLPGIEGEEVEVSILDLSGREVLSQRFITSIGPVFQLHTTSLAIGSYLLKVTGEDRIVFQQPLIVLR